MKKTRLLSIAFCICGLSIFVACGNNESKDNRNDTTTTEQNVSPIPMDTTNSMTDTSMTDTTNKTPR